MDKTITLEKNRIVVRFPYSNGMLIRIKNIEGRLWEPDIGGWTFRKTKKNAVILKKFAQEYKFFFDAQLQDFIEKK